MKLCYSGIIS